MVQTEHDEGMTGRAAAAHLRVSEVPMAQLRPLSRLHPRLSTLTTNIPPAGAAPMDVDEEGSEPSPGAVSVDDLLPRTSIAGAITPTLLSMLASSNWKERNTGIEQVDDLVRGAGGRIAPDLGELLPALKVCDVCWRWTIEGWARIAGSWMSKASMGWRWYRSHAPEPRSAEASLSRVGLMHADSMLASTLISPLTP